MDLSLGRRKKEEGRQKTEDRRPETEARSWKTEVGRKKLQLAVAIITRDLMLEPLVGKMYEQILCVLCEIFASFAVKYVS